MFFSTCRTPFWSWYKLWIDYTGTFAVERAAFAGNSSARLERTNLPKKSFLTLEMLRLQVREETLIDGLFSYFGFWAAVPKPRFRTGHHSIKYTGMWCQQKRRMTTNVLVVREDVGVFFSVFWGWLSHIIFSHTLLKVSYIELQNTIKTHSLYSEENIRYTRFVLGDCHVCFAAMTNTDIVPLNKVFTCSVMFILRI